MVHMKLTAVIHLWIVEKHIMQTFYFGNCVSGSDMPVLSTGKKKKRALRHSRTDDV